MNPGERIRSIRKEKGMTLKDLAQKTNMSEQAISQYERGTRKINVNTLSILAEALNVPIGRILLNKDTTSITHTSEAPQLQEKAVEFFAEGVIAIGMDMYRELSYEEMKSIAYSKELALFLEYMYIGQIQNRYKRQLEEIKNEKDT